MELKGLKLNRTKASSTLSKKRMKRMKERRKGALFRPTEYTRGSVIINLVSSRENGSELVEGRRH